MENTTLDKPMIEHARHYLKKGCSVIPTAQNKKPLVNWREFRDRYPTEAEVDEWWTMWPDAGVAIITGKISSVTVVDVEAGGDISKLPTTDTVKTGGGGWHFYYKYCPEMDNKTRILPLTDIRGNGGYVIAPPSLHASGKRYEVISSSGRADFPSELFGGERRSSKDWQEIMEGIPLGSRNTTATVVAGKLMRAFSPSEWESTVWIMMKKWNESNEPPLPEYELRNVYMSIGKREMMTRQGKPEEVLDNEIPLTFTNVLQIAEDELNNTRPEDVMSFGYSWMDEHLTGFFKGELVVIGGESGTGKTTFATNIILKAAEKGRKCMLFALEDRLADYGIKAIYFELGRLRKIGDVFIENWSWNDYRTNNIKTEGYPEMRKKAVENLKNENILFHNCPELDMNMDTLEKIIEKRSLEGVELFLIDHLHYFDFQKQGNDTKADYIEKMMVRLRKLQARTGARILLIVHYKKLGGKKPSLDSFKDSISIVQNANYVINLWRDRALDTKDRYKTIVSIPKTRNPNGEATIEVSFDPEKNDYSLITKTFGTGEEEKSLLEDDF